MAITITPEDVQVHILGFLPYLNAVGEDLLAKVYANAISGARGHFERSLHTCLSKTVIKQRPLPSLVKGEDYDVEEPAFDYTHGMIDEFTLPRLTLRKRPVISVEAVRFEFETGVPIMMIPTEWVQVDKVQGVISLIPVTGTPVVGAGMGIWFLPMVRGNWRWKVIPQLICVDYTAGPDEVEDEPEWDDLRWFLAQEAACRVLDAGRRLIPNNVTLDGFSQQFPSVDEEIRSLREGKDGKGGVKAFLTKWRLQHLPPMMVVI